jgi:hypothetical protein
MSCNKDNEHTSVLGSWYCDEYPEQTLPQTYQVNIERDVTNSSDSNRFVIYNFNNLGFSEEQAVFVRIFATDSIEILYSNNFAISVHGYGKIESGFSKIDWEYTVGKDFTENISATYY